MVQLKDAAVIDATGASKFQFLHGTIKSEVVISIGPVITKFQFLHGTIKSYSEVSKVWNRVNFNSFMVQLKASLL